VSESGGLKIRVSEAIPDGEAWLASGCSWRLTRPEKAHGDPEWRGTGMCVHEHLERVLLCSGCKDELEHWQYVGLEPPGPWCSPCYRMRPGGHPCTSAVEFRRLGEEDP
jgi:hypothetical protein